MKKFIEYLNESIREIAISRHPKIGWWLDNDPVTFYHGTHKNNLSFISKNGIVAPTSGPTAHWVSLALEPNTAHGYASMGGESGFRAAGAKAVLVPHNERITFVLKIPQHHFLPIMAPARGAMEDIRDKLENKARYLAWSDSGRSDQEYYAITEIRLPISVSPKFIVGYGYLRK